jgi:hypothetical protein
MQKNATTSDKCKQMQSFASENGWNICKINAVT